MPFVSIIVPCYNEESTIRLLLEAIYSQTFPRVNMEVVIADGMSVDKTRERVATFQQEHPDLAVCLVDNPKRVIPAALNRAIEAARGEYILRLDAHSMPRPDYVERCLAALRSGAGDNVGGIWEILPGGSGWVSRGIAVAASHPLGVGDAQYRHAEQAQAVDTVPFGAYHRSLVERIGLYNERLLTNEDYEFNARVRQSGGVVWLDPAIRSAYFARRDLVALARQYARFGFWKARMLRRNPSTLRWRQALPPLFVLSLLALALLSILIPPFKWLLAAEVLIYLGVLLVAGLWTGFGKKDLSMMMSVPLAVATMHLAWGGAFLWSLVAWREPDYAS
ncbi:MAG: glycosyltransferase family 2 protein [Anaerolineales bacterium]